MRKLVDSAWANRDELFDEVYAEIYAGEGRPSMPTERLIRACLLQIL